MENTIYGLSPFMDAEGRLTALPAKSRKKLAALWYLAGKLEPGRRCTEAEINDLLDSWTLFHDPASLRREMYNRHLLDRTPDGSLYWKELPVPSLDEFIEKYI